MYIFKRINTIFWTQIVLCCLLFGQLHAQHFEDIAFERLDISENNIGLNIYDLIQDKQGYLWLATSKGVKRYDGRNLFTLQHTIKPGVLLEDAFTRKIYQDSRGWIWIATQYGICRYNYVDNSFECFQADEKDEKSLNYDDVLTIYEDSKNRLWVGTEHGLNQFNYEEENFISYGDDYLGQGQGLDRAVLCVQEDSQQNLWIGTWDGGLKLMIPPNTIAGRIKESFLSIEYEESNPNSLQSNYVWEILIDKNDRIWLGTFDGGLSLMLPPDCESYHSCAAKEFQFATIKNKPAHPKRLPHNIIFSLEQDREGYIWLGTAWGLGVVNPDSIDYSSNERIKSSFERLEVQAFRYEISNPKSIPHNQVRNVFIDNSGIVWYATISGLVNYVPFRKRFNKKVVPVGEMTGLTSFLKDENNTLYIGTSDRGLFDYDTLNNVYTPIELDIKADILALHKTEDGTLWIGTPNSFFSYSKKGDLVRHELTFTNSKNEVNRIRKILVDTEDNMWLATQKGLVLFDWLHETYQIFSSNYKLDGTLNHDIIIDLVEDDKKNLYIATQGGGVNTLSLKDIGKDKFKYLQDIAKGDKNILKSDVITSLTIFEDKLWVGSEKGVFSYNVENQNLQTYPTVDAKIFGQVQALECDNMGVLWIGTSQGLFGYDIDNNRLQSYLLEDGIPDEINFTASYKDEAGELYFGGFNSYTSFFGSEIVQNQFSPDDRVLITGLKIAGQEVKINEKDGHQDRPILTQDITETKEIILSTKHTNISIDFAMLDYAYASRYTYIYRLKGLEKDWNYTSNLNNQSYRKLSEGDYTFEVKAQNSDGYVSEPTTLNIQVKAPFTESLLFKFLIALALFLFAFGLYWYRTYIITEENKKLERLVQQRTQELNEENEEKQEALIRAEAARKQAEQNRAVAERANSAKTVFLATMSHEIRTPMNGMLGMVQLLSGTPLNQEQKEYVELMEKSGDNLLSVINNILDFTKIESGEMELETHSFYLKNTLEEVITLVAPKAQQKGLELTYRIADSVPPFIKSDSIRLQQILLNLIYNAIKFTKKGRVTVAVDKGKFIDLNQYELIFEVQDTGIGILKEKQGDLFNAFSQVDSTITRKYGGSGLGLAICLRLVTMLNGSISLESKEGVGTKFKFSIVTEVATDLDEKTKKSLKPKEIIITPTNKEISVAGLKILVAEDNKYNQILLLTLLRKLGLQPVLADNGLKAVEAAKIGAFDLIFMDLDMPEMSGMEATNAILYELELSKPPTIVAISANVQREVKEECLAIGMKAFISKPFQLEEVKQMISEATNGHTK